MSRWKDRYVIGLTGNIAVGKSLVRQMLQHLGAYTIDADSLTHQAMSPGAPAYLPIVEMFGKFILDNNGYINRALLGSIVFSFPDALTKLEAIVHPVVNQAIMTLTSRSKQPLVVIEAIKLLESPNLSQVVDAVWVVDASAEAQLKRLTEKRKLSEDEARKRIIAQRPQADKLQRANVVIMNDGNPEETWKAVQAAWNEMRRSLKLSTIDGMPAAQDSQTLTPVAPAPSPSAAVTPLATPVAQPASVTPASVTPSVTPTPPITPIQPAQPQQPLKPVTPIPSGGLPGSRPLTPAAPPTPAMTGMQVRRGKPGETEQIASFINRVSGKTLTRMDIMLAFGQKSYLVAENDARAVIGVVGWQVENLITRVDEIYLEPSLPKDAVIDLMVQALEDHSKNLQSEVSFIVLPDATPADVVQGLMKSGYQPLRLEEIKFPAWREAAHELITPNSKPLMKPLRQDRIMKPI